MDKLKWLQVNKESKEHLYLQVYRALKQAIISGQLVSNDKLPPIRELAGLLHVNNSTIVQAYDALKSEGLVIQKMGSGTYVFSEPEQNDLFGHSFSNHDASDLRHEEAESAQLATINFASGTPSDSYFPVEAFKELINVILDRDGTRAFSYEDAQGYFPLRVSLSDWCKSHGMACEPKDIQVISGAQQGLDIVTKALLTHQDTVLVEAPTYTGALALLKSKGVRIVELPIVEGKVNMLKFKELVISHRPKLFFTMTNLQNPTGFSYSLEEKTQILELSKKYAFTIVEDDYASELNYAGAPLPALKSLDPTAPIIYIKSFSKVVLPGLRLGFMIVPEYLRERMMVVKHQTDISTSGLIQRSFDLYLRKGLLESHTARVIEDYKKRYTKLEECVVNLFPSTVFCCYPKGGANLWFELPENKSARQLYQLAKEKGVLISSGDVFYPYRQVTHTFRLSISSIELEDIPTGIYRLSEVLKAFLIEN